MEQQSTRLAGTQAPSIDMHTHVFNAAYLPLEGIFRARRLPPSAAGVLARILESAVGRVALDGAHASRATLAGEPGRPGEAVRFETTTGPSADDIVGMISNVIPEQILLAHAAGIAKALEAVPFGSARPASSLGMEPVSGPYGAPGADVVWPASLRLDFRKLLTWAAATMVNGKAVIDWVLLLLAAETSIVDSLMAGYPDTSLFVHHMMDMAPHYRPSRTRYPFADRQLRRTIALMRKYDGRLLPFIAYSPLRGDSMRIIEEWMPRGFAGVKFYPPNGYRPLRNTKRDLSYTSIPPEVVDQRNRSLFRYCARNGVPIFAHCQPGEFQRRPALGCLSHPAGWREVLADPEFHGLRLCLGHAGGEGWTAADGHEDRESARECPGADGFVASAIDLCVTHEHVYLEFGCMESLLTNPEAPRNLRRRLRRSIELHGDRLGRRIIYGSDWHMLALTPGARAYAATLRQIFARDEVLTPYEDSFFRGNSLEFLDLPRLIERIEGRVPKRVANRLRSVASGDTR